MSAPAKSPSPKAPVSCMVKSSTWPTGALLIAEPPYFASMRLRQGGGRTQAMKQLTLGTRAETTRRGPGRHLATGRCGGVLGHVQDRRGSLARTNRIFLQCLSRHAQVPLHKICQPDPSLPQSHFHIVCELV